MNLRGGNVLRAKTVQSVPRTVPADPWVRVPSKEHKWKRLVYPT